MFSILIQHVNIELINKLIRLEVIEVKPKWTHTTTNVNFMVALKGKSGGVKHLGNMNFVQIQQKYFKMFYRISGDSELLLAPEETSGKKSLHIHPQVTMNVSTECRGKTFL